MSKALSFTRLDFVTIKPYLTVKNLLLLLAVCVFFGVGTGSAPGMIGIVVMYSSIYASYPFAVGEKNSLDMLYATLPISRKRIVEGRYLFSLCMNVSAAVLSVLLSGALLTALNKGWNLTEALVTAGGSMGLFLLIESVQLPLYFKLGYAKAKFLVYLPLAAFPAVVIAGASLFGKENSLAAVRSLTAWLDANLYLALAFAALVPCAAFIASCLLSVSIYRKRDL